MYAKIVMIVAALAAVDATNVLVATGVSTTSRRQDSDGNYAFAYDITDAQGATNSRSESGYAQGNVQGQYSLRDTDGRSRTVDYIADKGGYRAVVKTNEPGTAKSAPASVVIDSPHLPPVAPEAPEPAPVAVVAKPAPITSTSSQFTIVHDAPGKVLVAHPVPVIVAQPVKVVRPEPVAHPVPVTSKFSIVHAAAPVHIVKPFFAPVPVVLNKQAYFYPRMSFGTYKGSPY